MGRILKVILFLVIAGFVGLTGFAYLGNLSPQRGEVSRPVTLDVD